MKLIIILRYLLDSCETTCWILVVTATNDNIDSFGKDKNDFIRISYAFSLYCK